MNIREIIDTDTFDGDEILSGKFPFVEFKSLNGKDVHQNSIIVKKVIKLIAVWGQ